MAELKKRNAELEALAMPPPPLTPASPPPELQPSDNEAGSFLDEPPCLSPPVLDSIIKSLDDSFSDEPPQLDPTPAREEPPDLKTERLSSLKEVRVVLRRLTEEELKSHGIDLRDLARPVYRRKRVSTTLRSKRTGKLQLLGGSCGLESNQKKILKKNKRNNHQSTHGNSENNEVIIKKKLNIEINLIIK